MAPKKVIDSEDIKDIHFDKKSAIGFYNASNMRATDLTHKQLQKNIDNTKITRGTKIQLAKQMKAYDFEINQIAKILDLNKETVRNYLSLDDNSSALHVDVKKLLRRQENRLKAKILRQMEERMPRARYYELTGAYKIISDAQREDKDTTQAVQVNVTLPSEAMKRYE